MNKFKKFFLLIILFFEYKNYCSLGHIPEDHRVTWSKFISYLTIGVLGGWLKTEKRLKYTQQDIISIRTQIKEEINNIKDEKIKNILIYDSNASPEEAANGLNRLENERYLMQFFKNAFSSALLAYLIKIAEEKFN
jgi:hypothetical protein